MLTGDKKRFLFSAAAVALAAALSLGLTACGGEDETVKRPAPARPAPPTPKSEPKEPEAEPEETPVYVYSGDRFRDPFTELNESTVYQPDAVFNPQQAKLTAVVVGRRIRSAVLQVPGGGSYFIDGARIIDVMGKPVRGFRAKVFIDKVVLSGEADESYVLKLRESEDEQEEKTL